ncbi:Transcription factor 12 [Merluccius polli]|uniref:Transcription factor 12 n=1 Tax=Merluccius polli TaxID=89951 RepID=A0AA47MFB4_MERPO|nr:Transcription factor 12 [Merluccius polli]
MWVLRRDHLRTVVLKLYPPFSLLMAGLSECRPVLATSGAEWVHRVLFATVFTAVSRGKADGETVMSSTLAHRSVGHKGSVTTQTGLKVSIIFNPSPLKSATTRAYKLKTGPRLVHTCRSAQRHHVPTLFTAYLGQWSAGICASERRDGAKSRGRGGVRADRERPHHQTRTRPELVAVRTRRRPRSRTRTRTRTRPPAMYCAYPVPGTGTNPMMYCYNMKPVYGQCPDNEDINQNPTSHLSNKTPNNVFASTFFEGTSNSADIWNTANGLNQQGYEGGPRGGLTQHHAEHGNYNNMTSHNHLAYSPHSVTDMNRGLPPMSTFHRSHPPRTPSSTASNSDNSSGNQGSLSRGSQTGDALGKALASIYSPDHTSSSFPSSASTPARSPSPPPASTEPSGPNIWPRNAAQAPVSPAYESSLISMVKTLFLVSTSQLHKLPMLCPSATAKKNK